MNQTKILIIAFYILFIYCLKCYICVCVCIGKLCMYCVLAWTKARILLPVSLTQSQPFVPARK